MRRVSKQQVIALAVVEAVRPINGMPGFMSKYASGFGLASSLNLQHLTALQAHEARMGKIEWYGESKNAIRGEELLRQPNMRQRDDVASLEFAMKTLDPPSHQRPLQFQR